MQMETQQNLQKEMQKMQQKFKAREDKSKKDHREEMTRVCERNVWLEDRTKIVHHSPPRKAKCKGHEFGIFLNYSSNEAKIN